MRRFLARLLLLACLVLGGAWFWNYENNTIQTDTVQVHSSRLPEAFRGLRVAVVSDVHGRTFGEGNADLLAAVEAAQPDLIAITGDLIESEEQLSMVPSLAKGLAAIAPTFYTAGNHEWPLSVLPSLWDTLTACGVTVLENDWRTVTRNDQSIVIVGASDPNGPKDMTTPAELISAVREAAGDPYILVLYHRNDALEHWAALEVDTVLSGHAHGGVVRLPGVGGLIGTDRRLFPEYTAGVYTLEKTDMAVSRGLGNTNINVRLFNRPELLIVELEDLS